MCKAQSQHRKKRTGFVANCLKYQLCLFCSKEGRVDDCADDMVQCDTSFMWYHCSCIGVHVSCFGASSKFHCCREPPEKDNFLYDSYLIENISIPLLIICIKCRVIDSRKGNRVWVQMRMSDVQTLYGHRGVSDNVIEFFLR